MITEKELLYAYMAGFVDADGYISIVTLAWNKQQIAKIAVCNTNFAVIDLFVKEFGGKVRTREQKVANWRRVYEWQLTSNKGVAVMKLLLPYLKLKTEQANLAIELQKLRQDKRITSRWHPELWKERVAKFQALKDRCIALNTRGTANIFYVR